jgi:hypothetical protein
LLTADTPGKPSKIGAITQMDYKIVPQADTWKELDNKYNNMDEKTKAEYSKMEVKLWESQRGEDWKWEGTRTGSGRDLLYVHAGYADQKWYIDGKRVQLVIGVDNSGRLIKAWTVHVVPTTSGPQFSKVE